jgi:hypothetical protein
MHGSLDEHLYEIDYTYYEFSILGVLPTHFPHIVSNALAVNTAIMAR